MLDDVVLAPALVDQMLTLQLQILNSLTKAASEYADLYGNLLTAYQSPPKEGKSWYRPPAQDPFSAAWPFAGMPANYALSPFYAFAMMGPMAWQNSDRGHEALFAAPLAMMNFWANAWGLGNLASTNSQASSPLWPTVWPFDQANSASTAMGPGYGMIKMSITFPDNTEIKFAFPGPPA